jgi:hypothetical protein
VKAANRYRVLLPLQVDTREGGSFTQGDEFETEFSDEEESANITSGLLEIVPARFKVIGEQRVAETDPGEEFEAVLTLGQQQLLLDGGHIERVETPPPAPKTRSRKKKEE